jgi:hypothetical protein
MWRNLADPIMKNSWKADSDSKHASPSDAEINRERRKTYPSHPEAPNQIDDEAADRRLALAYAKFIGSKMHYQTIASSKPGFSSAMVGNMFLRLHRTAVKPRPEGVYPTVETVDQLERMFNNEHHCNVRNGYVGTFQCLARQYELFDIGDGRFKSVNLDDYTEKVYRTQTALPKGAKQLLASYEKVYAECFDDD